MPSAGTRLPAGFPRADEPTVHRRLLDAIVAGTAPAAPCVQRLALPPPTGWSPGQVGCQADVGDEVCWFGVVFGGYLTCVIDLYGGLAMLTVLPDGARFLTAGAEVTFEAAVFPGRIRVDATVARLSEREAVVEVLLRQRNRLTTRATTTQIIQRDL